MVSDGDKCGPFEARCNIMANEDRALKIAKLVYKWLNNGLW